MPRYCHDIHAFFAVGTFRFYAMDWIMGGLLRKLVAVFITSTPSIRLIVVWAWGVPLPL